MDANPVKRRLRRRIEPVAIVFLETSRHLDITLLGLLIPYITEDGIFARHVLLRLSRSSKNHYAALLTRLT